MKRRLISDSSNYFIDKDSFKIIHIRPEHAWQVDKTISYQLVGVIISLVLFYLIYLLFYSFNIYLLLLIFLVLGASFLILFLMQWRNVLKISQDESKLYGKYKFLVHNEGNNDNFVNLDDPIINVGFFLVPNNDAFKFLKNNLTLDGLKLDDLRYLTHDEEHLRQISFQSKDRIHLSYRNFIPVFITKNWVLYPDVEIKDYIDFQKKMGAKEPENNIYRNFRSEYFTIRNYYSFDYSKELEYDLASNYGIISFGEKISATGMRGKFASEGPTPKRIEQKDKVKNKDDLEITTLHLSKPLFQELDAGRLKRSSELMQKVVKIPGKEKLPQNFEKILKDTEIISDYTVEEVMTLAIYHLEDLDLYTHNIEPIIETSLEQMSTSASWSRNFLAKLEK